MSVCNVQRCDNISEHLSIYSSDHGCVLACVCGTEGLVVMLRIHEMHDAAFGCLCCEYNCGKILENTNCTHAQL